MNAHAYEKLDYSLALLGAAADGKRQGCIINSLHQTTSSYPPKFTVTLNKSNETAKAVWCCIIKLDTSPSRIYKINREDGGQNGTEKSLRQRIQGSGC